MFREMRRFKQALSREECLDILREEKRGVLSVLGEGGYPYGVPMDHWLDEENGRLYFHGAKSGHKLDALRASDKVSYCVVDGGTPVEGQWYLVFRSVIVFGRIREVTDWATTERACWGLARKFTDDEDYIRQDIEGAKNRVLCLELTPEHISGKRVTES